MSKNLGRNSPCHCGSGKKHKKCCLIQDENKARIELNPDLLYENVEEDFAEDHEIDEITEEFEDNSIHLENEHHLLGSDEIEKIETAPLPEITDKEQQIVNDWGKKYVTMKDPDEFLNHLNQFLQHYPSLVPHLLLDDEVLFELGAMLLRCGRGDEYIEVLLNIRQNFPDTYMKSCAYYDSDLMVEHICRDEADKAIQYMGNFMKYPDNNPDKLFSLIDFLCATNQQSLLAKLLEKNYSKILHSNNIFGAAAVIEPFLWVCYYIPALGNPRDEQNMIVLSKAFKALNIDLKDEYYQPEFLLEKLNEITEKIENPLEEKYRSTKNVMEFYHKISMNFIGWLHKEKNIPLLTSYYYHTLIVEYFHVSIPAKKRPKKPFLFIQSHFDQTLARMSTRLFDLSAVKVSSSFRAFYWFADYLLAHQAISEIEAKELQGWCKMFNEKVLPGLLEREFEAQYFVDDILS